MGADLPPGIYAAEKAGTPLTMVGYVMVIYDYDVPEYDIWHMMIDEAEQGRGYGRAALDAIIEYIRTKPFGDSNRVALTCNKDNAIARKLYERMGFSPTAGGGPSAGGKPCDHEDEDETGLAMTVEP